MNKRRNDKMINRKELVDRIHADLDLAKKDVESVVRKLEEKITEALSNGEHVNLTGFGKWVVKERAARTARVPSTGEPVEVPAQNAASFKPSAPLKEAVKNGTTDTTQQ